MFCSQCGTQVPDAAKFCPACGTNTIGGVAAPAPSVAAQQAVSAAAPRPPQSSTAPAVSVAQPAPASRSSRLPLVLVGSALAIALAAGGYLAWTKRLSGGTAEPVAAKTEGRSDKPVTAEQAETAAAQAALDREIGKEEKEAQERRQAQAQ